MSCGWSHNVATGVTARDGSTVFVGWGRADMGQLPIQNSQDTVMKIWPVAKKFLNTEVVFANIWCGSEFTVGLRPDGVLMACGWAEHHTLGQSDSEYIYVLREISGVDVLKEDYIRVIGIACGGAHTIAKIENVHV